MLTCTERGHHAASLLCVRPVSRAVLSNAPVEDEIYPPRIGWRNILCSQMVNLTSRVEPWGSTPVATSG